MKILERKSAWNEIPWFGGWVLCVLWLIGEGRINERCEDTRALGGGWQEQKEGWYFES